ncbi:hypothetical protein ACQP2T_60095 [Nonomuraea sp. CA-143628]|uniref:hypothetical protein n=1 Tax=Nonomuraea sp. CA-143628 TaxID=3239997 RepID=UPI003D91EF94
MHEHTPRRTLRTAMGAVQEVPVAVVGTNAADQRHEQHESAHGGESREAEH